MQELQVANMRSRTKAKQSSRSDRTIDGAVLAALVIGLLIIGGVYGYLLANM